MNQELTPAVLVGCSGWQYKHWRGDFYLAELPQSHQQHLLSAARCRNFRGVETTRTVDLYTA
jgi:uncharacterized protein YecE (DUF72 family)